MPIPTFKDQLQGNLAPGITIISSGNYFDTEEKNDGVDIATMNEELEGKDEIIFMPYDSPKEDLSFKFFMDSQKKSK